MCRRREVKGEEMDTNWAKKQMRKGKKVRRKWWEENEFVYFDGKYIIDNTGLICPLAFDDYEEADDWELFKK